MPEVRPQLRTYLVWVNEEDKPPRHEEAKSFSPQDLVAQYEMMGLEPGKEFKIIRELAGPQPVQNNTNHNANGVTNDKGAIPLLDVSDLHKDIQEVAQKEIAKAPEPLPVTQPEPVAPVQASVAGPVATPTKIWKAGGIEFKLEGGKMYQKEWIDMNASELTEKFGIRVRSLESGEISELEDYRFEINEWVEVEEE